ncbi:MAG TPA: oligosaccharide flippase family protein [Bacteroidales bacterium]|nr:oligosaccharide flippase family protein [Bacteroidales bacterium]
MRKFSTSEFSKNVITLLSGTTIAQAVPILISPILTRLYTPEEFGLLALFTSLSFILGAIANGCYEFAVILPKKDSDAINIAVLGALIAFVFSILLLVTVIVFNKPISTILGNVEFSLWLYLVPVSVLAISWFNIFSYYNVRIKQYRNIAKANIIKAMVLAIIQVSLGFAKVGTAGLISGQLASFFSGNYKLSTKILKKSKLFSYKRMKLMGKRYIDFPKFMLWSTLANTLSIHVSNIFINIIYSSKTLGFFSLANRTLGMPSSLIGSSIGQVFFQQASIEYQKYNNTKKIFVSTLKKLIIIGIPIFTLIFFFIEDAIALIFGEIWRITGLYCKILTPMFFIRFVSGSLSSILNIFEKQKIALLINLTLLFSIIVILFTANFLNLGFEKILFYWSITLSIEYSLFILIYYRLSNGKKVY